MENYILDVLKIVKSKGDTIGVVVGADADNKTGTVIGALSIAETLASTLYKTTIPGAVLSGSSLLNNLDEANKDLDRIGKVDDSTMMALTTDAFALLGLAASLALAPEVAAVAVVAATALAIAGAYQGKSTDISDTYLNILNQASEFTKSLGLETYINDLLKSTGDWWANYFNGIADEVNSLWHAFKNWTPPRRDPLVLDLDGDGIETLAVNATTHVVFDYDSDGVKTGTGWIKGDDGFVVLDRNGNGVIDNGGELFGDQTLVNGVKASDGFAALSAEDTNKNGKFDAGDSSFTAVRIWQDTNSDGISQTTELHTMNELGITSINLTSTTSNNQNFRNTRRIA